MRKRNLTLDYMKGIAIFMVVMDHVLHTTFGYSEYPLRSFIYSLHMPIFFFVSGYLTFQKLNNPQEIWNFICKKSKLLLPLLFFGSFNVICIGKPLYAFIKWEKFGLWFLMVLFCFNAVYAICQRILIKNKNIGIEITVLIIPMLIGIMLRKFAHTDIGNALNFLHAYNYSFFIMGVLLRRYQLENFILRNDVGILLLIIYIIGLNSGISAFNIPMKATGVLFLYSCIKKLNNINTPNQVKWLSEIGRKSLYIYILHYYALWTLNTFPEQIGDFIFSTPIYYLCMSSFISISIILFCIVLSQVLCTNNYIEKYIFGGR